MRGTAGPFSLMSSLSHAWRRWRRLFKSRMPFVRRRVFSRLQSKYDALADAVHPRPFLADEVPMEVRQAVAPDLAGEVCLFVTHAPQPVLKPHVVFHLEQLLRAGLRVVLIVNTDVALATVQVPPELQGRLSGVFVRDNRGYDFGAWSHVLRRCNWGRWERLFLVNDSIVGPLRTGAFDAMLACIRASDADIVGLTEGAMPIPHLQSYFLVLRASVLGSAEFRQFVDRVINFDDKAHVVDVYELRFTRSLRQAGFTTAAVFPASVAQAPADADVLDSGASLVEAGFPYVKTRVLRASPHDATLRKLLEQAGIELRM